MATAGIGAESEESGLADEALNVPRQLTGVFEKVMKGMDQILLAIVGVLYQQLACMAQDLQSAVDASGQGQGAEGR